MRATIKKGVSLERAKHCLSEQQFAKLKHMLSGSLEFRCWAMTKNSRSKFDAMQSDDWVLFTTKGTGRFTYQGRVIGKLESLALGNALWSITPNLPWEPIYFVGDTSPIDVRKERIVTALGYKRDYVVPGIIRVDPARIGRMIQKYGGISEFISALEG